MFARNIGRLSGASRGNFDPIDASRSARAPGHAQGTGFGREDLSETEHFSCREANPWRRDADEDMPSRLEKRACHVSVVVDTCRDCLRAVAAGTRLVRRARRAAPVHGAPAEQGSRRRRGRLGTDIFRVIRCFRCAPSPRTSLLNYSAARPQFTSDDLVTINAVVLTEPALAVTVASWCGRRPGRACLV